MRTDPVLSHHDKDCLAQLPDFDYRDCTCKVRPTAPMTFYQVGSVSGAGFPILFDHTYSLKDARTKAIELGHNTRIFKVTVEEVKE